MFLHSLQDVMNKRFLCFALLILRGRLKGQQAWVSVVLFFCLASMEEAMKMKTFCVMTFSVGVTLSLSLGLNMGLWEVRLGSFSLTNSYAKASPTQVQGRKQVQAQKKPPLRPLSQSACRSVEQRLGVWLSSVERVARAQTCPRQRGKLQRLCVEGGQLRRSVKQVYTSMSRRVRQIAVARSVLKSRCSACLSRDECGSCPRSGAQLRRRCGVQLRNLRLYRRQLRVLGVECARSESQFKRLRSEYLKLFPRRPSETIRASGSW